MKEPCNYYRNNKILLFLGDIQETGSLIHVCRVLVKTILHLTSQPVPPHFLASASQDTWLCSPPRCPLPGQLRAHSPATVSVAWSWQGSIPSLRGLCFSLRIKKIGTSVKFLSTQIFVLFPGTQNTQDWHWHISCVVSASFDYQGIAKQTRKIKPETASVGNLERNSSAVPFFISLL